MDKKQLKKEKFAEEIQQKVSQFLKKEVGDRRLTFVSITKVELNEDFSQAVIYWDSFDNHSRGDTKKAIEGVTGIVRRFLAEALKVRVTPSIRFAYDSRYEDEKRITDILEQEKKRSADSEE